MDDLSPPPPRTTRTPPLPPSCPFKLLKKQAEQNSSRIKKKKKEDDGGGEETLLVDDEDVIDSFVVFNQDLANRDHCLDRIQRNKGVVKKCNCLSILHQNKPFCAAVGEYQAYFASQKREDQQKVAIDWMRTCEGVRHNAPKNSPLYPIPFLLRPAKDDVEEEEVTDFGPLSETLICRDSLMDLLNIGYRWWITVTNHCKNHTLPSHKLRGLVANNKRKWNDLFESDLIDHFEELRREAEPIATRFVRELTGELSERDTNEEAEYLSPHWSKRQCYYKFCASLGVKVESNSKGNLLMTRRIMMQPPPELEEVVDDHSSSSSSSSSSSMAATVEEEENGARRR